jgi:hypothetical protein
VYHIYINIQKHCQSEQNIDNSEEYENVHTSKESLHTVRFQLQEHKCVQSNTTSLISRWYIHKH